MVPAVTSLQWALPFVVYACALVFGRTPERAVGAMSALAYGFILTFVPHGPGEMLTYELGKQGLELLIILGLALRYDRWWLLVAAMMQALVGATDIAGMVGHFSGRAFSVAAWTWGYIYLAAVAYGTWECCRDRLSARRPGMKA